MAERELHSRMPFDGSSVGKHHRAPGDEPGIAVRPVVDRVSIHMRARRGSRAQLEDRIRQAFGVELPARAHLVHAGAVHFVWAGYEAWIVYASKSAVPDFEARLASELADVAAVVDQSDARATLHLEGKDTLKVLSKLSQVDFHPRIFGNGDTCLTRVANLNAQITRIDDSPAFEIAVPRAFAASFWEALLEAAAEFGVRC